MDDVTKALFSATTADEIRDLIARGADISARDRAGNTPAHMREGINGHVLAALVEAGVDVHARNRAGESPFHIYRIDGYHAEQLIHAGADPTVCDNKNITPLHYVGDGEAVRVLVSAGADINACDSNGCTPLIYEIGFMEEAQDGDLEVAQALLDAGADPTHVDSYGQTAISLAIGISPDIEVLADFARVMQAKADRDALNADDTLERIKASKPATPKKRGPL